MQKFIKDSLSKIKVFFGRRTPFMMILAAAVFCTSFHLFGLVKTVKINNGTETFTVYSISDNIESAVEAAGFDLSDYKITSKQTSGRLTTVSVEQTFPVYITFGNDTHCVKAVSSTVSDILGEAGFEIDEYDLVEPSADTLITETAYIDYTDISYVTGSYTESIPHEMNIVYSSAQKSGTSTVQNGSDGLQQVNYTSKVVNGVTVEMNIDSVVTLSYAVNGTKTIGTGGSSSASASASVKTSSDVSCISTLNPNSPIYLDANGVPVSYSKRLTVQATAYTYTGHNCATGVAPQPGYIAVNPNIIPYGTRMYIVSSDGRYVYGYAIAADTGGFVKKSPTNVDLFMPTKAACSAFGRRNVEIYILD